MQRIDWNMDMNRKPGFGALPCWIALVLLSMAPSSEADEGYRFLYRYTPGTYFVETDRTQQESGGKLIASFRQTVEFQVSPAVAAPASAVTARITSLSNMGRRIDYYDDVIFHANISATGAIGEHSVTGGLAKYGQLIQASGAAKLASIFWMPPFPADPLRIGDAFSHSAAVNNAQGETIYKLQRVEGHQARFRLHSKGVLAGEGVSGTQETTGWAVFDLQRGMWSSFELEGEGIVKMAGAVSAPYKVTIQKEISDSPKGTQGTSPCQRLRAIIAERLRARERLIQQQTGIERDIESHEADLRLDTRTVIERHVVFADMLTPEQLESAVEQWRLGQRTRLQQLRGELQQVVERRRPLEAELARLRERYNQQCL